MIPCLPTTLAKEDILHSPAGPGVDAWRNLVREDAKLRAQHLEARRQFSRAAQGVGTLQKWAATCPPLAQILDQALREQASEVYHWAQVMDVLDSLATEAGRMA